MEPQFTTVNQQVDVGGEDNEVYVSGGDLFVGHSHVHYDAREDFVRLTVETLRLTPAPRNANRMARMLRDQKGLVLGGPYDDKPAVARQLAAMVARASPSGALPLLEWNRGTDVPGLLRAIHGRTEPSLLLLTAIEPRHVRHDLEAVFRAAGSAGHRVVVTTDVPLDAWRLTPHEAALWVPLEPEGLFDEETLAGELMLHLRAARDALGTVLREEDGAEPATVAGVPVRELAAVLGTPPNIVGFVQQLVSRAGAGKAPVDEGAVRELAQVATRRDTQVTRWFHGVLSPREQLLAVCLSFFDGLFEDQFFAALERWIAHVRETRDPSVPAFDYLDLDNLLTVFAPVEGSAGTRFETRSADDRAVLLRAAWRTHRRQIMAAMGVLTELVAQSAYGRGTDWELYGSRGRRAHLRRVVAEALSDLGTISETSVERALLRLAGDGNAEVQGVAASSVARWRLHGRDAQLFRLLDRWQKDARIRSMVEALVEGKEKVRTAEAHIRSTVALAVGYAVEYDPPNQLTKPLVALIRDLASDRNRVVRRRFTGHTLPRAVALHLAQLADLLREIAPWGLEEDVARALAYAAETRPHDVAATLEGWHRHCEALRARQVDPRRVTPRETLLRVLAYTYGALDYEAGRPFSAEQGFDRLRQMLARESHPAVRDAVVDAMILQARQRFHMVESLLQQMMGDVAPREQDDVVRRLVEVYFAQREEMTGNAHVSIGGRSVPGFVDLPRPLTAVEQAMMRWMRDPAHPAAQRVGMRALLAFVEALDGPESEQLARISAERRMRAVQPVDFIASAPARQAPAPPGWYKGTVVPWLATRSAPELQPVVAGLLPEALAQQRARPAVLNYALGRWESMRADTGTQPTARRLRSALSWHANAGILLAFGGIAAILLLVVLLAILAS
jgi:hypothetical protein